MNAVIYLDVPEWQIGQDVTVYFPDTMVKRCKCELLKMPDMNKVIKGLEICKNPHGICPECPYNDGEIDSTNCTSALCADALALLKEHEAKIKKYKYLFDFLGIGFREWATKILDGEAEATCEADEHEHKTVITFKMI